MRVVGGGIEVVFEWNIEFDVEVVGVVGIFVVVVGIVGVDFVVVFHGEFW